MPANTPNRGYPYSIPADNNDVAGSIQALAEAVDTDLFTLGPSILPRRVARVSRTTPVSFGTTMTARDINWNSLDINLRGTVGSFPEPFAYRITPQFPGWWMGVGEISFNTVPAVSPPWTWANLELNVNNIRRGRTTDDDVVTDTTNPQTVTMTVGGGYLFNGTTDYFNMAVSIERVTAGANIEFFAASMTIWQLTES